MLDYVNRVAYVSLSKRPTASGRKVLQDFNYEPMLFESVGDDGRPIYHTNVVMCIGSEFALVGLELIPDSSAGKNSSSSRSKRKESDRA